MMECQVALKDLSNALKHRNPFSKLKVFYFHQYDFEIYTLHKMLGREFY